MARARFGRLPRSAPSLTSTIVSLAQQYQGDRDRNIETAWKNGGLFEGKKVTDEQFLKHWQGRLGSVSKDDPMWDYYNNLIYSYEFTIAESKMGQKYAEESVSDGEMAAFYRKWAGKMPMNSQNYRQLMTQAAKFKAAATSRGYSRRSGASTNAYNTSQQKTYDSHEAPYDTATGIIARYAVGANYLDSGDLNDPDYGWSKLTNSSGENDPSNFADLLSDIMARPDVRTYMTQAIRAAGDENFSGTFNEETLAQLANNARNGALARERRARKAGDTAGANKAAKSADKYAKSSMVIRATLGPKGAGNGFVEQNESYRAEMDAVLATASGASPTERAAAIERYGRWLAGDASEQLGKVFPAGSFDPLSKNYNPYASGLMGRVKGTLDMLAGRPSGKTLKDDLYGFDTESPSEGSDAVKTGESIAALNDGLLAVADGTSIVIRSDPDGKVNPRGSAWAIVDKDDPDLVNKEIVPFSAPVPGMPLGEVRYTQAVPVKAHVSGAIDPRTGAGVSPAKANPLEDETLGSMVTIQGPAGQEYRVYGIFEKGQKVWTYVDPFSVENRGNEGLDEDGSYRIAYADPAGRAPGTTQAPYSPKKFIAPGAAKRNINGVDSTDGTKWDPATDKETGFNSPMAALANTSSDTMRFIASLGASTVAAAERDWYSKPENQTPEMKNLIMQGADPNAVVEAEANRLVAKVRMAQSFGYTPEDQQASRSRLDAYTRARMAQAQGLTVEEATSRGARDDIVAGVTKWGLDQREIVVPGARPGYGGGGVTAPTAAEVSRQKVPEWQQKGWSVGDLLNQPGMSTEQANDLAYRISHGAVGAPGVGPVRPATGAPVPGQITGGPQVTGGPRVSGGPRMTYRGPYVNPFDPVKPKTPVFKPKPTEEKVPGKADYDVPKQVKVAPPRPLDTFNPKSTTAR